MGTVVTCPECHESLGAGGRRAYKHAISCFHLDDVGVEQIVAKFSGRKDDYAKRVLAIMEVAKSGGE